MSTFSVRIQTNIEVLKIVQRKDIKALLESENQFYYLELEELNQLIISAEKVKKFSQNTGAHSNRREWDCSVLQSNK